MRDLDPHLTLDLERLLGLPSGTNSLSVSKRANELDPVPVVVQLVSSTEHVIPASQSTVRLVACDLGDEKFGRPKTFVDSQVQSCLPFKEPTLGCGREVLSGRIAEDGEKDG